MSKTPNIPFPSLKSEIPAGIHLSVISNIKDVQNNNVLIEFTDLKSRSTEIIVNINDKLFKQIVNNAGLRDVHVVRKKDILFKRVWLFVKLLVTVDGMGNRVKEKTIIFDTYPYTEITKPHHPDNPDRFNGELTGEFIEFNEQDYGIKRPEL